MRHRRSWATPSGDKGIPRQLSLVPLSVANFRVADHSGSDPYTVTHETSKHMSGNGTNRESSAYRPASIATHSEDTGVSRTSCSHCGQCRDPCRELPESVRD